MTDEYLKEIERLTAELNEYDEEQCNDLLISKEIRGGNGKSKFINEMEGE